jgi:hypothetical protein
MVEQMGVMGKPARIYDLGMLATVMGPLILWNHIVWFYRKFTQALPNL